MTTKTFHVDPDNPSAEVVNLAATRLRSGGVVIFPTETVYGLGALGTQGACYGSTELFDIKQRPVELPIPLLVEGEDALDTYGTDIPEYAHALAKEFWPGPLTLVIQASEAVNPEFRAADGTIGVRCPANELVRELIIASGGPLLATSANTHGQPAPISFEDIEPRILEAADVALDGGSTLHGIASTVLLCTGPEPKIVRSGAVSDEAIAALLRG